MGEPPDQVEVKLTCGFWLGKYEVTQAQYEQVVRSNPSHSSANGPGSGMVSDVDAGKLPVEQVSWTEASQFCRKLTAVERQAGRLSEGWEYALPMEAQWEYACRAGTQTAYCKWRCGAGIGWRCLVRRQCGKADARSGREAAQYLGYTRHARQRVGLVQGGVSGTAARWAGTL